MNLVKQFSDIQYRRTGNARWKLMPNIANSVEFAWYLRRGLYAPDELKRLMSIQMSDDQSFIFDPEKIVRDRSGRLPKDTMAAISQIESKMYLRNQLLRDSDWASMDHSVELRTPLVDAWLLRDLEPVINKFSYYPNKQLLAKSPLRSIDKKIFQRRKTGFNIPIQKWINKIYPEFWDRGMSHGWARAVVQFFPNN